jgi:hypothetical protein
VNNELARKQPFVILWYYPSNVKVQNQFSLAVHKIYVIWLGQATHIFPSALLCIKKKKKSM